MARSASNRAMNAIYRPTSSGSKRRSGLRLLPLLLLLLLLCACQAEERQGAAVRVFSGKSPEQLVLGKITTVALEHYRYRVVDRTGWGSAWMVRKAFAAGNADVCWEYTGDTWRVHLEHDRPIWDAGELYDLVRDEDALQGITWLAPAPCERALGLIMRAETLQQADIGDISGLIEHITHTDPTLTLCVPQALYDTPDGIAGLERVYEFQFDRRRLRLVDMEQGYQALLAGDCDCILNYSSPAAALQEASALKDDRRFFPPSELAVGARTVILQEHPNLEAQLSEISRLLTQERLATMVWQVTEEGRTPESVARQFLRENALLD